MKIDMTMDKNDELLTREECLHLITRMINYSGMKEMGRINFVTIYGLLGFLFSIMSRYLPEGGWCWLWVAVPFVSYGVPFACYRKRWSVDSVFSRITKKGFLWFMFMGVVIAVYANYYHPDLLVPMMTVPLSCAMILLCGLFHDVGFLSCAVWAVSISLMAVIEGEDHFVGIGINSSYFYVLYFALVMFLGASFRTRNKKDDNEE